jgi:hypothetical protein
MPNDALQPDELIEELVPDPAQPPNVVGLDGYIGRSSLPEHTRLYRDLSASYWLDIPTGSISHARTVDVEGKFHPISVVWVERDAVVRPGATGTDDQVLVDFLSGEFTAGRLTEVELPDDYKSETGLWCNDLKGTIRHIKYPKYKYCQCA